MTISDPAPSPKPFIPPSVGNTVGCVNIYAFSYAFLYQSILNDGTRGGIRLNEPEMRMCGSLSLGNDQEKLKNPLIRSIALRTVSFALLIFSDMLFLMSSNVFLIESPSAFAFSLIVSQFLYRSTPAATSAPIASTTRPIGEVKKPIVAVKTVAMVFIPDSNFATGEIAATIARMVRISVCVSPSNCPNHESTSTTLFTSSSSSGTSDSASAAPALKNACVAVFFNLSTWSLNSCADSTASSERIRPVDSASSPSDFSAAPPSSTIPAISIADLPNKSIDNWSRSVSFSTLPSASTASYQTSVASRMFPSASVMLIPNWSKTSEPDAMFFVSFVIDPVMDSNETSTKSDAYFIFCSSSTLNPVRLASVERSSALDAAFVAIPSSAVATPPATVEMPLVFSATCPALVLNASRYGCDAFN